MFMCTPQMSNFRTAHTLKSIWWAHINLLRIQYIICGLKIRFQFAICIENYPKIKHDDFIHRKQTLIANKQLNKKRRRKDKMFPINIKSLGAIARFAWFCTLFRLFWIFCLALVSSSYEKHKYTRARARIRVSLYHYTSICNLARLAKTEEIRNICDVLAKRDSHC